MYRYLLLDIIYVQYFGVYFLNGAPSPPIPPKNSNMSKSFSFRPDGSRVYDSAEPTPEYLAYGHLAALYEKFRDCTYLPGAITRLRGYDDPRVFAAPETLLAVQDPGENTIIFCTPYNHFLHGPRCALANAEAHIEWKKRKDKDYKTREELLTKEELVRYAADGCVPAHLKAAPVHPEPISAIIDLSGYEKFPSSLNSMMFQLMKAHRKHRLYVNCVISNDDQWKMSLDTFPTGRAGIKLFKMCCQELGDDPGGARGCVESELRQRFMINDGSYALMKCEYSVRKAVYTANRSAILDHRRKTFRCSVSDERESWNTKIKWACDFQKAKGGISLHPPKTSSLSKKRKRKTTAAEEPVKTQVVYGKSRCGVAKASEENLQIPQIHLASSPFMPQLCDVVIMSAESYTRHFKAYIEDQKAYESCASKVIVLDPQNVVNTTALAWLSWASLLNARIVSNPIEIEHLYLLLQWLPLWWDEDKHVVPSKAKPYPKMMKRVRNVVENMPRAPGTDEYGETEADTRPEWLLALADAEEHMPYFATACGLQDE